MLADNLVKLARGGVCVLQVEKPQEEEIPQWDEKNPLCPRTVRSNGEVIVTIRVEYFTSVFIEKSGLPEHLCFQE